MQTSLIVRGNTPLIWAVLSGRVVQIKALLSIGANKDRPNKYGMTAAKYAKWMKLKNITTLFKSTDDSEELPELDFELIRLNSASAHSPIAKRLLILSTFANLPQFQDCPSTDWARQHFVEGVFESVDVKNALLCCNNLFSDNTIKVAKLNTLNQIASGDMRSVIDLFIINLYILSDGAAIRAGDKGFLTLFMNAVATCANYDGEVYVKLPRRWNIGDSVQIATPFSGHTLWKRCSINVDQNDGTLGIFHGGKILRDSEVILLPGSYDVKNWYHYTDICLAQVNIRESAYSIKEKHILRGLIIDFAAKI